MKTKQTLREKVYRPGIDNKIEMVIKGSGSLLDKVSAWQPWDCGFELQITCYYKWVMTMISHMAPVMVGSRKQTQEWLKKLWELASQSS